MKAIKNVCRVQVGQVKVGNKLSRVFPFETRVCTPPVFKIYLNEFSRNWKRSYKGVGISLNVTILFILQFTDDADEL